MNANRIIDLTDPNEPFSPLDVLGLRPFQSPTPTYFVLHGWDGQGNKCRINEYESTFYYNAGSPREYPLASSRTQAIDGVTLAAHQLILAGALQFVQIDHHAYGCYWVYDQLSDCYDERSQEWRVISKRLDGYWHIYIASHDAVFRCEFIKGSGLDPERDVFKASPLPENQHRNKTSLVERIRAEPRGDLDQLIAETKGHKVD